MIRQIGPLFGEAYGVLAGNRVRSFLTILGLIIGVAAVISIQVLGKGMSGAVSGVLGTLNDRSFFIYPNTKQADFTKAAFDWKDVEKVPSVIPNVIAAIPGGGVQRLVTSGHDHGRISVGADSDTTFAAVPLVYGRNLSREDVEGAAHDAVLTDRAYQKLFPGGGDPVGQSIRVGEHRFVVVGIQGKPLQGILPLNFGADITIPYTTYVLEYLHSKPLVFARFLVRDSSTVSETETAVIAYFRSIKQGRSDYMSLDRKTLSSSVDAIFTVLTLIVAVIGAVSLLVAGIGIMNIMLVSVSERTREIGLRKAIGATSNAILAQFFIEALLLSLVGCGIGLFIGLGIGFAVDNLALVHISGVVPDIPWFQSVVIAVGFATVVTVLFGTYPAYRAARLDPIDALRYE